MRRNEFLILLLCLLIAFALRFYTFDKKSLWLDEIYTFNDAKYGLKEQLDYYKENPNYFHPPLFFIMTHQFYPFAKPERDLRIFPLIFGTLSIPMIYFLSRLFSPGIALPCALSLTFMTYHISLSQEGRSYSLMMFLGMVGLIFFIKHLRTLKRKYLIPAAFFYAILFYTSYSSIPFIVLSQILWFYRLDEDDKRPSFSSFLIFNSLIFLICLPWLLFISLNYKGHSIIGSFYQQDPLSFGNTLYGILNDWVSHTPLTIISIILLALFPIISKFRKNAFVLLALFILPIGGVYLFCKLFNVAHFITSRYFINLLPLFFVTLFLSLDAMELRFKGLKRFLRLKYLFVILFLASNLLTLPLYYRSEKQDFRGLANYLKGQIRDGDKIFVESEYYIPGILHYLGVYPKDRLYSFKTLKASREEVEYNVSLIIEGKKFTIFHPTRDWVHPLSGDKRLWILVRKGNAKELNKNPVLILKGYFDGSFLNFDRFPTDASLYLFLWDPSSLEGKRIDMPIG